jgi:hypothetical protein
LTVPIVSIEAFAAGGWWVGLTVASVLIAVLATLVLTVITLVNRIERQAGSILDNLTATGERLTVGAVVALLAVVVGYLRGIGRMVEAIGKTLAEKVARRPGGRPVT